MDHHEEMQDEKYLPTGFDLEKLPVVVTNYKSIHHQVGTLGGGNHFIELQRDDEGRLWIMIHSGSRNLGKQVGDFYNKKAKWLNELYYSKVESELMLPFLPLKTHEFNDYWGEMNYCIAFAKCNRQLMMERIKEVIVDALPLAEFEPTIDIAHNYAAFENHFGTNCIVHRKGAVRARVGEIGIIPGSQGTSSYIVEGLGNADSFMSSSHGAGRVMSRTQAIKTLNLEDEIKKMESKGIVHSIRSQRDLDEAASAYKDIDQVIALETDLVKVITKLEPLAVIKG
jgi:tRNA-splicing ligase RtcB